ncbi:hypothetical protein ACG04R_16480 [Roseateles sp. BYS78W]|uniref:NERD domain-containing protein n=1 Tax=Pelomonas candidula TaxID=3299025 RepID=A0ABW7HEE9_9BURK
MKSLKQRQTFAPHITRYRSSLVLSALGIGVGVTAWVLQAPALGGLFGLWAARRAWTQFKDGARRHQGFIVEAEHLEHLKTACQARGWRVDTDVWIDGIGNLDAVVSAEYGRVIIEIKSYGGLRELEDGSIVRCNKLRSSAAREVQQVHNQAFGYCGLLNVPAKLVTKVLWCPSAPFESVKETREGVVLANGPVNGAGAKLMGFIERVSRVQTDAFAAAPLFPEEAGMYGQRRPEVRLGALDTVRARVLA